jgi:hypothetical protein
MLLLRQLISSAHVTVNVMNWELCRIAGKCTKSGLVLLSTFIGLG